MVVACDEMTFDIMVVVSSECYFITLFYLFVIYIYTFVDFPTYSLLCDGDIF